MDGIGFYVEGQNARVWDVPTRETGRICAGHTHGRLLDIDILTFTVMAIFATLVLLVLAVRESRARKSKRTLWLPLTVAVAVTIVSFGLDTMIEQRLTIFGLILLGAITVLPNGTAIVKVLCRFDNCSGLIQIWCLGRPAGASNLISTLYKIGRDFGSAKRLG